MKVYVIIDEWSNNLKGAVHEEGDDFVAVCATKMDAEVFLSHYDREIDRKFKALQDSSDFDYPLSYWDYTFSNENCELTYKDNVCFTISHRLYVREEFVIGGGIY